MKDKLDFYCLVKRYHEKRAFSDALTANTNTDAQRNRRDDYNNKTTCDL